MTTSPIMPAEGTTSVAPLPVAAAKPAGKEDVKKAIEAKWGKPNIAAGWTCIPNILIKRQQTLGIDALDLNILLHLLSYWWEDENHAHPSKETLALSIGVHPSTIQRRIRSMEAGGLIKRIERRRDHDRSETNLYDLTPLRALLEPHAELELAERKAGHTGRRNRTTKVAKIPSAPAP